MRSSAAAACVVSSPSHTELPTHCLFVPAFLYKIKSLHRRDYTEERKSYEAAIQLAATEPSKYMVITCDGMDSVKTRVPHSAGFRDAKEAADKVHECVKYMETYSHLLQAQLEVSVLGVIVHHRSHDYYLHYGIFPHDANAVISCICKSLRRIYDAEGRLPDCLRLQLDNAGSENKNRFMLGFAALLKALKVFKEVRIYHSSYTY